MSCFNPCHAELVSASHVIINEIPKQVRDDSLLGLGKKHQKLSP